MRKIVTTLAFFVLINPTAYAALTWQPAPPAPKVQASGGGHQGHGSHRGGKPFILLDGEGAEAQMWLPTQVRRPLHVGENGQVMVGGSGLDNYHLLFARKRTAAGEEVALRYLYQHGRPSGESPAGLVNYDKAKLELIPAPLTREHQRYLSQKPADFLVYFNGKPLAEQAVILTTSNGSRLGGKTDTNGRITLSLPDDFSDVQPGRRSNAPADFVVATVYEEQGRRYHTTMSAPYYVNPSHWRSTVGGLIAMLAGGLAGFVVLRRSRNGKAGGA
jgi:hypothetical protein